MPQRFRTEADLLVVAPYRGIMAEYEPRELMQTNIHQRCGYPGTAAGRLNTKFLELLDRVHRSGAAYYVSDERTVEQRGVSKTEPFNWATARIALSSWPRARY